MNGFSLATLADLLELGGPVVMVLMLMSIYALAIVVLKLWQFRTIRLGERRFIDPAIDAWGKGDTHKAGECLKGQPNPIAQAMNLVVKGSEAGIPEDSLREEVARTAARDINVLRRHFRPLEVIGNIAPLLGLLGTVIGMIAAFNQLEAAGSQVDPSVLSGGIWEALLTTAVGLVVAIPTVAALNFLERSVERLHEDMQDALGRVVTSRVFNRVTADSTEPSVSERNSSKAGQRTKSASLEGALAGAN
ncbi:MotA/TolQ/ExbB proton channel family protein [Marinimicrobium koreense]|uniref:MotA/TolQ/ExbB proton channel family protein n=1 Tax=Marinimicrobium koreense TaxID=306545 RepID=UPI003F6F5977